MAKVAVLAKHDLVLRYDRYNDTIDVSRSAFRKHFGTRVPDCTCKHRHGLDLAPVTPRPAAPGGFKLSDGPESGWVLNRLQSRLQVLLVRMTGDTEFAFQEIGNPETHTPGIEAHVGRTARSVMAKLRHFELHER
jgi:hypothetical protein